MDGDEPVIRGRREDVKAVSITVVILYNTVLVWSGAEPWYNPTVAGINAIFYVTLHGAAFYSLGKD